MQYYNQIIFVMEIIGTIAFASSGAMVAIRKEMDLFGICVLAVTTSVGGGLIRDLILGITPPNMFVHPIYTIVALGVALLLFIIVYNSKSLVPKKAAAVWDAFMRIFDAIGLGVFTVVGINAARTAGQDKIFLMLFVGVTTGVGGGLLRDLMAQEKPFILHRHVYACASLAGAVVCVIIGKTGHEIASMIVGAAVVIVVRLLAAHYNWNLPKTHFASN